MDRQRFYRVQDGKVIAGVCNGLARHLNVDVTWVRVAFAVAALVSAGLAFWGYLFMWAITPTTPEGEAPVAHLFEKVKGFFTTTTAQGYPKPEQRES